MHDDFIFEMEIAAGSNFHSFDFFKEIVQISTPANCNNTVWQYWHSVCDSIGQRRIVLTNSSNDISVGIYK